LNPIRWAAILSFLTGVAGVLFMPQTVVHIARYREHPLVFPGVRGLAGTFDAPGNGCGSRARRVVRRPRRHRAARHRSPVGSRKLGGVLAAVLFVPSLVFRAGFALPGWLNVGPLRMVLVWRGRDRLP
jgi:hypothetical protein